jgi:hypothetical protein
MVELHQFLRIILGQLIVKRLKKKMDLSIGPCPQKSCIISGRHILLGRGFLPTTRGSGYYSKLQITNYKLQILEKQEELSGSMIDRLV